MGIVELFEVGFFTAFWNWSNPLLTVLVYACVLVGTIFQGIIQKKSRKPILKWLLLCICGIGMIVSEFAWQRITGWERLGVDFVYGFLICVFLGVLLAKIILFFKSRHSQK